MPATIIDEYKIFPRIMMLMITILTYQAVHWYMSLPDNYKKHHSGSWVSERLHGSIHRLLWHLDVQGSQDR